MAKANFRTWVNGEFVTDAMLNEQIRDNGNEMWKGTAAGDMDYYTSAITKAALALGSNYSVLTSGSDAPVYRALGDILQIGVSGSITADTTSVSEVDIPGSSFTINLNRPSKVFAIICGAIWSASSEDEILRIMIGDNGSPYCLEKMDFNSDSPRTFCFFHYVETVPAGTVTIKGRFASGTGIQVHFYYGRLIAFAIPTA